MPDSKQQFENHKISETLDNIRKILKFCDEKFPNASRYQNTKSKNFKDSINLVEETLINIEAQLFPSEKLLEIDTKIRSSSLSTSLQSYSSNMITENLEKALEVFKNYAEQILNITKELSLGGVKIGESVVEKAIREFKENTKTKLTEITEEHEKNFTEAYDKFEKTLEEKAISVTEIHELVSNYAVSEGYDKNADEERGDANLWRQRSILLYVLSFVWVLINSPFGLILINDIFNSSISYEGKSIWEIIVTIAPVTGILLIIAKFASNQSRLHRQLGHRLLWFSLDTKSIIPFLTSLPKDLEPETKNQIILRLFGQDRTGVDGGSKKRDDAKEYMDAFIQGMKTTKDMTKDITKGD